VDERLISRGCYMDIQKDESISPLLFAKLPNFELFVLEMFLEQPSTWESTIWIATQVSSKVNKVV